MFVINLQIAFALICIFGVAQGANYNIAVSYKLASDDATCSADEHRIESITLDSLKTAGVHLSGKKWKIYENGKDKTANNGQAKQNPDDFGIRKLFFDEDFCEFMCRSQGRYCWCCSSCGGTRRLRVQSDASLAEVQETVHKGIEKLLSDLDEPIACLDPSNDVEISVERD